MAVMKLGKVSYVRQGAIVVLKNSRAVTLAFGNLEFHDTRWVVTLDIFEAIRQQNPNVSFVDVGPKSK